jgi:hypothetical protein
MTPDQAAQLAALVGLFTQLGGMPIMAIMLLIIIGPWLVFFFVFRGQERRLDAIFANLNQQQQAAAALYDKRFDAFQRVYENNISLVKKYEKLADDSQKIIIMNSEAITKLITLIENNQFCPLRRKQGGEA